MIELLQTNAAVLAAVTGILGLIIGSFLNVVIYRLPLMLERDWLAQCRESLGETAAGKAVERFDLTWPASTCPQCGHRIRAVENIPVLSYLLLRGKCAECRARIPVRYPLVELLTALLSVMVMMHFGATWQGAAALVLTWALVALSFIDIDHQLLPDIITMPVLWIGLLLSVFGVLTDATASIVGAAAGYLLLWSVYRLFKLVTGKEGMGYGDFKLLALLGAWLGWQFIPLIVLLSSLVGAVVGISMAVVLGRDKNIPIPFGPYLAAAGWIAMLWGDAIMQRYLTYAGGA